MEEKAVRVAKERGREKGLANVPKPRPQAFNAPFFSNPHPLPPSVKKLIFHSKVTKALTLDETLPITNKSKHPQKGGNTKNKMEGLTSKKTKGM